jgi:DNA-binding CsgD family transcriptional regulator
MQAERGSKRTRRVGGVLTARERQILDELAVGASTVAIAGRLGIATKTVNNNLSAILTKIEVVNRTEAVLLARRAGLGERPRRGS